MIKRIHARICIILMGLCLGFLALCVIFSSFFLLPIIFAVIAVGFFFAAFILRIILLKCPSCGKSCARPQWSKGQTFFCSYCGKPYEYDR